MLGLAAAYAGAQEPNAGKPAVTSQLHKVEATVESIDSANRELSLRGPRGPVTVAVGPDAKNFDQIHVGDKVVVSYYQGIAAQMSKDGKKVTDPATSTFAYPAGGGTKPGGGVGQSVTVSVTIQDVDPATHTVAFKSPDGLVHMVSAKSPDMQKFVGTLKRGDIVDVTYTESLAVNVMPARR
jgi:hypothetical protein